MERKIGKIFKYKDKKLKVIKLENTEDNLCYGCYFEPCIMLGFRCGFAKIITGYCSHALRKDRTNVIFKEV